MSKKVTIDDVVLHMSHPDELPMKWVGQRELMDQILAAWLVVNADDLPLNPRLIGKPGVGKTTLAYAAAKKLNREQTGIHVSGHHGHPSRGPSSDSGYLRSR